MKEKQTQTGTLTITVYRPDGTTEVLEVENLITDLGRAHFAALLAGAATNPLVAMAVGTGDTAPDVADLVLDVEVVRVDFSAATSAADAATFTALFPVGSFPAPVVIEEAGLFDNSVDVSGDMTSRVLTGGQSVGPSDALGIAWTITFNPA